jgi:hypothetical protein
MKPYAVTSDTGESLLPASSAWVQFWQWREKGGEALRSSIPSSQFLSFGQGAVQGQDATLTYGTSFTKLPRKDGTKPVVIPPLENINLHHPALTSKVRSLLRNFWAIVVSKALQSAFPITRTAIAVFSDPAEDRQQVVLRVFAEANATQAVAFWESLESNIQEWILGLDNSSRLTFLRKISLRIHWR